MKRIAVFCDGTWNRPDSMEDGVPVQTNVVRLARSLAQEGGDGARQRLYYDPGIGTSGSVFRRWFDGATGSGISKNILQAYRFLIGTYEPGDEIYLFGYSRGAFTVRSLAGLIRNCGILRRDATHRVDDAYELYRARSDLSSPRAEESVLFRRSNAVEDVSPIHFIGVWDTVGSLGNPLLLNGFLSRRNRFHDTQLSSKVRSAYHALAIDEKRLHFKPTLWHQSRPVEGQTLEQVWFVGAHGSVGGGLVRRGLSDIALAWMKMKAEASGLAFEALTLEPNYLQPPSDSKRGIYRLLKDHHRPILRADARGEKYESIHESVIRRYNDDPEYRPPNLLGLI